MASVTVVSCYYGDYGRFLPRWREAVAALDPQPDDFRVVSSQSVSPWRHPQAYYLQLAISLSDTEWVWIVDIDDQAIPDGLAGLDDVTADVWAVGYLRSDGETYIPPQFTAADVLGPRNLIPAGSMIRTEAFRDCGGYLDVALQDWALWRRLAANGATFASSDRAHYLYNRHPRARGAVELTYHRRPEHEQEMHAAEEAALAFA